MIRENQAVIIEDLSVRNMVRNRQLARAISDASWSELRRMLEYKADWYGRKVIAIDRFYPSSKTCSACGAITAKMPLNIREWRCAACGASPRPGRECGPETYCAAGLAVTSLRRWCETAPRVALGGDRQ